MFGLVTAQLSPEVQQILGGRGKEISNALQKQAGVACVLWSKELWLIQGEWKSISRAYDIVETIHNQESIQENTEEKDVSTMPNVALGTNKVLPINLRDQKESITNTLDDTRDCNTGMTENRLNHPRTRNPACVATEELSSTEILSWSNMTQGDSKFLDHSVEDRSMQLPVTINIDAKDESTDAVTIADTLQQSHTEGGHLVNQETNCFELQEDCATNDTRVGQETRGEESRMSGSTDDINQGAVQSEMPYPVKLVPVDFGSTTTKPPSIREEDLDRAMDISGLMAQSLMGSHVDWHSPSKDLSENVTVGDAYGQKSLLAPTATNRDHVLNKYPNVADLHIHHAIESIKEAKSCRSLQKGHVYPRGIPNARVLTKLRSKTFRCDLCGVEMTLAASLDLHKKRFHTERKFKCRFCHRSYALIKDFNQHMKSHTVKITCSYCGVVFKHEKFRDHLRLRHNVANMANTSHLTCGICRQVFSDKLFLMHHLRHTHADLVLPIINHDEPDQRYDNGYGKKSQRNKKLRAKADFADSSHAGMGLIPTATESTNNRPIDIHRETDSELQPVSGKKEIDSHEQVQIVSIKKEIYIDN